MPDQVHVSDTSSSTVRAELVEARALLAGSPSTSSGRTGLSGIRRQSGQSVPEMPPQAPLRAKRLVCAVPPARRRGAARSGAGALAGGFDDFPDRRGRGLGLLNVGPVACVFQPDHVRAGRKLQPALHHVPPGARARPHASRTSRSGSHAAVPRPAPCPRPARTGGGPAIRSRAGPGPKRPGAHSCQPP